MDWTEVLTIVGTGIGVVGFIYQILRNFRHDFEKKFDSFEKRLDLQDERIFLLATSKSLSQAMTEAKRNMESK